MPISPPDHLAEYINAIVTLLVGLVAFVTYAMGKRNERQNAARIVIADVRHAEAVVSSVIERNTVDMTMKDPLEENNWSRYKHLFAGHLSSDDFAAFNKFFLACGEMSDARSRMRLIHYAGLEEKARLTQQEMTNIAAGSADEIERQQKEIMGRINRFDPLFQPAEPQQRFVSNLQQMGRLSTTIGFEKLRKIAVEE